MCFDTSIQMGIIISKGILGGGGGGGGGGGVVPLRPDELIVDYETL